VTDREIYALAARSRLMRRLDEQDAARKRRPPPADPANRIRRYRKPLQNPDCARIVPIAPMTVGNR
jgi:hypothetical protein